MRGKGNPSQNLDLKKNKIFKILNFFFRDERNRWSFYAPIRLIPAVKFD